MYLKSLDIQGFKSFADKIHFEFSGGITAIVGPNGSGKSNVADAVRWVLGEQSSGKLRSTKMEDVIFAGTQVRKPMGFAAVTMVIDNADHSLSVPYAEVKIARRVYRSGESEYLLNGASCRLKDVQEILFDTGIGKEGYSLIGQGQVDRVLSGKPEDRRELFDEAAGIVKYKKRRQAAEKDLEKERQNLARVGDILAELEKQKEPLEQEAKKAKRFLSEREKLKNLEINLFLTRIDESEKLAKDLEEKIQIAAKDLAAAEKELSLAKRNMDQLESEKNNLDQDWEQKNAELSRCQLALGESESQMKLLSEQILSLNQNKENRGQQAQSLQKKKEEAKKEKEECEKKKEETLQALSRLSKEKTQTEALLEKVKENIAALEKQIESANREVLTHLNEGTDVMAQKERVVTLMEQAGLKENETAERLKRLQKEKDTLQAVFREKKEDREKAQEQLERQKAEQKTLLEKLEQTQESLEKLTAKQQQTQKQYHIIDSRLQSLRNLTQRYEGYGGSVRRVMEQRQNYPGIVGAVADIIRVDKEYELAVETALGGSIQNIVTDNENTAKQLIAYLKKNQFGRATFLPLSAIKARPQAKMEELLKEPGVVDIAANLTQTKKEYEALVQYLLGRFIVVSHIDFAVSLAQKYHHTLNLVTLEGELLKPGGSMAGGAFKNMQNLLGRRRETEKLERQAKELREESDALAVQVEKKENLRQDLLAQTEKKRKQISAQSIEENTAKLAWERVGEDVQKNAESIKRAQKQREEETLQREDLQRENARLEEKVSNRQKVSQSLQESLNACSKKLAKENAEQKKLSEKLSDLALKVTAHSESLRFLEENSDRIQRTLRSQEEEIKQANDDVRSSDEKVLQKEEEIDAKKKEAQELRRQEESLKARILAQSKRREELNIAYKDCACAKEEMTEKKTALEMESFRLDAEKEKFKKNKESDLNYMWEEYELSYSEAKKEKKEIGLPPLKLKEEIARVKGEIKSLGDVNVGAMEQYNQVKDRAFTLSAQQDDIKKAESALNDIIDKLEVQMRRQFETEFARINRKFDQVFRELFGGGKGSLELTDSKDVLLSGIRIVAQPPGKKLQNMMQLSGGEKALSAIALLFAIQQLKPSPFCLLDEIEAALDDANVARFADYLKKLTADIQFIVITHRHGTMDAADSLYGITMQEKGVSTQVSVKLT